MKHTYLTIDSSNANLLKLQTYLNDYGDLNCVCVSTIKENALHDILKYRPALVLINLDKDVTYYFKMVVELYQYLENPPLLIALSNTKKHAYESIKFDFFDYWLQPFNEYDILKSLYKLRKKLPKENTAQTICLKSYNDFQYIKTKNILYLKADNNATDFIMTDGSVNTAYKTLKTFVDKLPSSFVRIHQSFIVNTLYVSGINYGKSICSLRLAKKQLPFSKSYRLNIDQIKALLSQSTITALN